MATNNYARLTLHGEKGLAELDLRFFDDCDDEATAAALVAMADDRDRLKGAQLATYRPLRGPFSLLVAERRGIRMIGVIPEAPVVAQDQERASFRRGVFGSQDASVSQ